MPDNSYLLKFEAWVSGLPDNVIKCRNGRHRFADWEDKKSHVRGVSGWLVIEVPCLRKCGTTLTHFVDPDTGYIARSNVIRYDYDSAYIMPKEVRSGRGITREMNAVVRAERSSRLIQSGKVEMEEE
jgi:hypothetical protein